MARYLPSAQAKRGDENLDHARNLRDQWKDVIPGDDMESLQNRITMATDMRDGLDSKRGLPRMTHARAYRRYAKETLHIVKTISDRARDTEFFGISHQTLDEQFQRTIDTAEATYRCYLSCKDFFPTPEQELNWVKSVWPVACSKTCTRLAPPGDLAERLSAAGPRFRADVKAKITPLVERFYEFETGSAAESLKRNTDRARDLKTNLAFINGENELPYRHPIIQQAINVIWFGERRSEGIMFPNEFYPIPYEAIALILTVVECCLDEWSRGAWNEAPFTYEHYREAYTQHLDSLKALSVQGLETRHCDPLHQLRRDLYDGGRRHAGVSARAFTDGRHVWSQDRVDAACKGLSAKCPQATSSVMNVNP